MGDRQLFRASATVTVDAPRGDVWALWVDVSGWPNWSGGIDAADLDGLFRPGSTIALELAGGRSAHATLVSVGQGEEFADETVLPFGILRNRHRMEPVGDLVAITHEVEAEIDPDACDGFTADAWPALQADVWDSLAELADLAQVS